MLRKLLKYDLKYMIKNMSVFYILVLIGAIFVRIFDMCPDTTIVNFAYSFSIGFLISMIFSIIFNTIIRSWVLFKSNVYGDEGYLTNTLPVTKKELYESRFIKSIIFLIVGCLVIFISLFIAFYSAETLTLIKAFFNKLVAGINYSGFETTLIILSFVIIVFLELLNAIQSGFYGIILGYRHEEKKNLFAFINGGLVYFVSQLLIIFVILIAGIINPDIMNVFSTNATNIPINIVAYISVLSYILITGIINVLSYKILNKGVNIE